ncbi:hypothetical protein LXA43DRAFT_1094583 [Ganoderma leucocontextum]|nr:hypothetical protein LXA43DRAFT_1094583 [Ganoderma leucocontextum]
MPVVFIQPKDRQVGKGTSDSHSRTAHDPVRKRPVGSLCRPKRRPWDNVFAHKVWERRLQWYVHYLSPFNRVALPVPHVGIRNHPYFPNETANPSTSGCKTPSTPSWECTPSTRTLWVVYQRPDAKQSILSPQPLEDNMIPEGDSYRRARKYDPQEKPKSLGRKHGDLHIVPLVLDDKALAGGENFYQLRQGFGARGLGVGVKVEGCI